MNCTAILPRSCPRLCPTHLPLLSICKGLRKADPLWQRWASPPQIGTVSCKDYAHENPNRMSWIQVLLLMVGSSSPLCLWSTIFAHVQCGPELTPTQQALLLSQSGPMAGLTFFFHPDFVALPFPPSALPCLGPPPPLASLAHCFSHLPVWPSTRRPWPPPCSVFEGPGAGESRFLCGERCCKGVLRSGSSRVFECICQGLGLAGRPA